MKKKVILSVGFIAFLLLIVVIWRDKATAPESPAQKKTSATSSATTQPPTQTATFDKQQYSLSDPASIWIVVNKQRQLNPKTYAPGDLVVPSIPLRSNITSTEKYVRSATADALQKLAAGAAASGLTLNLQSGYRSYDFQVALYNSYVSQDGQAKADTYSARPGYSEHQTGFAADLGGTTSPSCNVEECYANTPEGQWLAAHSWEYGFIIRYPKDKTAITGYTYEPWHVRYVGVELSTEMHKTGIETLEEFFGLPAAPVY